MSTDVKTDELKLTPVQSPLTMKELGAVLVKHYGINDGLFELLIEFQIGMGPVGPTPELVSPGAMIGVSKIGLAPVAMKGLNTIDAAEVNPKQKPAARKKPSS